MERDPEEDTFDEARLLRSGQQARSVGYQLLEHLTLEPLPLLVLEYWPPIGLDLDLHHGGRRDR